MSTKLCAQERAHCGTHGTAAVASTISAGTYHTCAVTTSGGLMCWGSNIQGQLGIGGDTPYQHSPTAVDLGSDVFAVAVVAGAYHTCALKASGGLLCWGLNNYGQLGIGSTTDQGIPAAVDLGSAVSAVAISAGTYHTCAVATGGGLLCWGGGYSGQLGIGNFVDQVNPAGVDLGSGYLACASCPPGSYSSVAGSANCSDCGIGEYSNASGATSCASCWASGNQCTTDDIASSQSCARCNRLRVRQVENSSASHPVFACRFGDGPVFPELPCLLPSIPRLKNSCDFERSLSCTWRPINGEDTNLLQCTVSSR